MQVEMLVLPRDNVNTSLSEEEAESRLGKRGDVVAIAPKGWVWGRKEVKEFLIVEADLSPEECVLLCEQGIVEGSRILIDPGTGEEIPDRKSELICRRRHYVDLDAVLRKAISGSGGSFEVARIRVEDRAEAYQPAKDYRIDRSDIIDRLDDLAIAACYDEKRRDLNRFGYIPLAPSAANAVRLRGRRL